MKLIKHISILILMFTTSLCYAQDLDTVEFDAILSSKEIGVNETFKIEFRINKDADGFVPPNFNNFKIIAGPNRAISNSWIDGKRSYSKTYAYTLKPKGTGDLIINQAIIKVDDVEYKTKPVSILATKEDQIPKDQKSEINSIKKHIHVVTEVSKNYLKLKDSLLVTHRIYVSQSMGVSSWEEVRKSIYKNWTSQNIPIKELKIETVKFKGENYRTVIVRKAILKPTKTGVIKIEPTIIDFVVDVPNGKKDIFGGSILESKSITLKSNEVKIIVTE